MRYLRHINELKSISNFTKEDIEDMKQILLEVEDIGYKASVNLSTSVKIYSYIQIIGSQYGEDYNPLLVMNRKYTMDNNDIKECLLRLKECLLHLKDYIGDRYAKSIVLYNKKALRWEPLEITEEMCIDEVVLSIQIYINHKITE